MPLKAKVAPTTWQHLLATQLALAAALVIPVSAGGSPCAACHPKQVARFSQSAMGRSIQTVTTQPPGRFTHPRSHTQLTILRPDAGTMIHRLQRQDSRTPVEYPVAYAVGSGTVGFSYLVWLGESLFQSPASYYTQTRSWDLTPGYEPETILDFTHPIAPGCLFCHTGSALAKTADPSGSQYTPDQITAIDCDRCHGPSQRHLSNPQPGSIVNPAKLAGSARDSVCEQCHLEGETRVLHPGRAWLDFQPGAPTESVFTTFIQHNSTGSALKAVSQSEQLAESRCARGSAGKLWCGTCHDPHGPSPDRRAEMKQICSGCHAAVVKKTTHAAVSECVSCHMPRLRPTNVAHASISDHRIINPLHPPAAGSTNDAPVPWRVASDNAVATRALGLALYEAGAAARNSNLLQQSYEALSPLLRDGLADAEVEATLASLLLGQRRPDLAVQLLRSATRHAPRNARYACDLGVALRRTANTAAAIRELERSISLEPSDPRPYRALAALYADTGQPALRLQTLRRYLQIMPQNVEFGLLVAHAESVPDRFASDRD